MVSSHTIYRPRGTDRQLFGDETLLSSYDLLRATQVLSTKESQRLNLSRPLPRNPSDPPQLSSRRSCRRQRLEGSPTRNRCHFWMVQPCPGADDTKESLSFERQPSLFKGRNQSWFHPLRTPSRPGAAAPGPHGGQRAVEGAFVYHLPAAPHRPPAARCWDTLLSSYDVLRTTQGPFHQGIPATQYNCHPERAERVEGSPTRNRCLLAGRESSLESSTRRNPCPLRDNLLFSKGETNRGFTL